MHLKRMAASTAIILSLTASTAFAAIDATPGKAPAKTPEVTENDNLKKDERDHTRKHTEEFSEDPVKRLEEKKSKILKKLEEGKITKEKADIIIDKIDKRINEMKAFQKLPLEQKREKLIKDFQLQLDAMVKEGKMKQEEADRMMKEITEKINKWDGKGYPKIHEEHHREHHREKYGEDHNK